MESRGMRGRPAKALFWDCISPEPNSGCWLWTAYIDTSGYGHRGTNGNIRLAHRLLYELRNGSIPAGMWVAHRCQTRSCVNPDHLEAVPQAVILARGMINKSDEARAALAKKTERAAALRRAQTHCLRGHAFTEKNTYRYQNRRYCRRCRSLLQGRLQTKRTLAPLRAKEKLTK